MLRTEFTFSFLIYFSYLDKVLKYFSLCCFDIIWFKFSYWIDFLFCKQCLFTKQIFFTIISFAIVHSKMWNLWAFFLKYIQNLRKWNNKMLNETTAWKNWGTTILRGLFYQKRSYFSSLPTSGGALWSIQSYVSWSTDHKTG